MNCVTDFETPAYLGFKQSKVSSNENKSKYGSLCNPVMNALYQLGSVFNTLMLNVAFKTVRCHGFEVCFLNIKY